MNAPEFDGRLVDYLKGPDREAIMGFDEEFLAEAGECGLRSFIMMFGALDEFEIKSEVYSYEGPFGVGYAVAEFTPVSKIQEETLLDRLDSRDIEEISTYGTPKIHRSCQEVARNVCPERYHDRCPGSASGGNAVGKGGSLCLDQEAWKAEGLHWDHNADTKKHRFRDYT